MLYLNIRVQVEATPLTQQIVKLEDNVIIFRKIIDFIIASDNYNFNFVSLSRIIIVVFVTGVNKLLKQIHTKNISCLKNRLLN